MRKPSGPLAMKKSRAHWEESPGNSPCLSALLGNQSTTSKRILRQLQAFRHLYRHSRALALTRFVTRKQEIHLRKKCIWVGMVCKVGDTLHFPRFPSSPQAHFPFHHQLPAEPSDRTPRGKSQNKSKRFKFLRGTWSLPIWFLSSSTLWAAPLRLAISLSSQLLRLSWIWPWSWSWLKSRLGDLELEFLDDTLESWTSVGHT